jgi:hypothetical protein
MDTKDERQDDLMDEISRYLATVEVFRSVGCEPHWRPESVRPLRVTEPPRSPKLARRAH